MTAGPTSRRTPTTAGRPPSRRCSRQLVHRPPCPSGCARATSGGNTSYAPEKYRHVQHSDFGRVPASGVQRRRLPGRLRVHGPARLRDPADGNLTYNPTTGINYPFATIAARAYPDWGLCPFAFNGGVSNSHALQTGVTKRFSHRWQASATYTLMRVWDHDPPIHSGLNEVPFALADDLSNPYTPSVGEQRHRAVLSAVFQLPADFQLGALYTFGSGERFSPFWWRGPAAVRDDGRRVPTAAPGWHDHRAQQLRREADSSRRPAARQEGSDRPPFPR